MTTKYKHELKIKFKKMGHLTKCAYKGLLFSLKKEQNSDTSYHMNETYFYFMDTVSVWDDKKF